MGCLMSGAHTHMCVRQAAAQPVPCTLLRIPPLQVQKLHDGYVAQVEGLKKAKDIELREHRD